MSLYALRSTRAKKGALQKVQMRRVASIRPRSLCTYVRTDGQILLLCLKKTYGGTLIRRDTSHNVMVPSYDALK